MNLSSAQSYVPLLLSGALFLQALEYVMLLRSENFLKVWSFKNLKYDLYKGLPLPQAVIDFLFSDKIFKIIILLQIITTILSFFFVSYEFFVILFLIQLYICIRFRGTFNGGSDMMSFVVLTGLIISLMNKNETVQKLGMIYIAIHLTFSYLKAGFVKVIQPEWRNGLALPFFLKRSIYSPMGKLVILLQQNKLACCLLSWLTILFELSIVIIFKFPDLSYYYFLAALIFHFLIYFSFGLNRFFWIWLSAWPALLYTVSLLNSR